MKKLVSMRDALSDRALLADALPGDSWSAWRVILIAAVGEALTDTERAIFKTLTGRERESGEMVETLLIVSGRRSGKSKAMAALTVYLSCLCDWSSELSLGERGLSLYLAPTERQASVVRAYAEAIIDHVELLSGLVESRTASSLTLRRGIDLETQAASPRYSRGATAISICLDECAYFHSADDLAVSDAELMVALRPSLATTSGVMLLTSSPAQMEGVVFRLHKRHFGPQGDQMTLVVQSDTLGLNPSLRKSVVDRAYEDDPIAAEAEFGGKFRLPTTAYLERAVAEKAVDVGITGRTVLPGVGYAAFLDVAGGSGQDSFCAAVGHNQSVEGRQIAIIDGLFEQPPKFDPDEVTARCAAWLRLWGINFAYSDSYAARWPVTAFARHGINIMASPLSASELYAHTIPAWTAGRVRLLDHQRAVDQLCGLKRKLGQGGREIIEHPRGSHDDLAVCIAGVLWRLTPVQPAVPMTGPISFSEISSLGQSSAPANRDYARNVDIHAIGAPLATYSEPWREGAGASLHGDWQRGDLNGR